jgi:hypothetical protein
MKTFIDHLRQLDRIAGPDDPIYQSGLVMTRYIRPKIEMSTKDQKAIVERMRRDSKYKQD